MTSSFCKSIAVSATLGVSALAVADEVASNIYTVAVAANTMATSAALDDQFVEVYDAATRQTTTNPLSSVSFAPNSIFRKKGPGYLTSSFALKAFTGEIRVEEGGLLLTTNLQAGATNDKSLAPRIVVSDGASLVLAANAFTCDKHKFVLCNEIHLAGSGKDGIGALCSNLAQAQQGPCLKGVLRLDADADVGTMTVARFDAGGSDSRLELGGHKLRVRKIGNKQGIFCLNGASVAGSGATGGLVVTDGGKVQIMGAGVWDGSSDNVLEATHGEIVLSNFAGTIPWTIKSDSGTIWADGTSASDFGVTNLNRYAGPVSLVGSLAVKANAAGRGVTLAGPITGAGSMGVLDAWLQLANAENAFSGRISVTGGSFPAGLGVLANGSVPPGNTLSLNDARLALAKTAIDLPNVDFSVSAGQTQTFDGGTNGTVASIRKYGAGTLNVTAPLSVTGTLAVVEGTVKLRHANAGLVCGRLFCAGTADENRALGLPAYKVADLIRYGGLRLTNRVDYAFDAFNTSSNDIWRAMTPDENPQNLPCVMVTYTGYVWNRSAEEQTWTIAGGGGTHLRLAVNATSRTSFPFVYYDRKIGTQCNFTLNPGANLIEITSYSDVGILEPRGQAFSGYAWTRADGKGAGLMVDRQGRGSTNCADYEYLEDPGDGSVFTQSASTSPAIDQSMRFSKLRLNAAGTLDLNGNQAACETLTGFGTLANSNVHFPSCLTVREGWNAAAADLVSGACLSVDGTLEFAEGAAFEVNSLSTALREKAREPIEIARASTRIVGLPDGIFPSSCWRLEKSADEKSLFLSYQSGGLILLVR